MTIRPTATVRPASRADLDALLALEEAVFPGDRLDRRNFRHAIASPSILSLVVERDGALAGYALVETRRTSRVARLSSIAISPGAAGAGLGRTLLAAAEAAAAERGCRMLRLEVRADNSRAARLYAEAGYGRTGREPNYYEDGEAAERWEKALG